MTNLDLHNKLLEVGKALNKLLENHPELQPPHVVIQHLLEANVEAEPIHPPKLPLYRTGG
jgi:hypothetical protein